MSLVLLSNLPPDGNPNGLIDGPKGTQFYKTGSFYKINYTGSVPSGWQDVVIQPFNIPGYYLTDEDIKLLNPEPNSFLYIKNTHSGTKIGWTLLATKSPFVKSNS